MPKFTLIAVEVLRSTVPGLNESSAAAQRLLQLANAWLQRRAGAFQDDLVLVGVGFDSEDALRALVAPFGLKAASLVVVDGADDEDTIDTGELIGAELDVYQPRKHPAAIPLAAWPRGLGDAGYPDDVWWLGLECLPANSGEWTASLKALLDDPFRAQASSWEAVLSATDDLEPRGDGIASLRAGLTVAALARWLCGFNAVTDNTFFDFGYGEVVDACELDPFLLGLEAGTEHPDELADEVDHLDAGGLQRIAVWASLTNGGHLDTGAIRRFFGSTAVLFYSLHSSIWPTRTCSAADGCHELCS